MAQSALLMAFFHLYAGSKQQIATNKYFKNSLVFCFHNYPLKYRGEPEGENNFINIAVWGCIAVYCWFSR